VPLTVLHESEICINGKKTYDLTQTDNTKECLIHPYLTATQKKIRLQQNHYSAVNQSKVLKTFELLQGYELSQCSL
jgi:hypothetical protein